MSEMSVAHVQNVSGDESNGLVEVTFSFLRKLFQLDNGKKMEFVILETSRDAAHVARFIERCGGLAMIKPNFASKVINLCSHWKPFMSKHVIFDTSYVFDCCALNKKLCLRKYSIGKTLSDEEYREFDRKYIHSGCQNDSLPSCSSFKRNADLPAAVEIHPEDLPSEVTPVANISGNDNNGVVEVKFSFSRTLFQLDNGKKMEFVILETSRDATQVAKFIERGGGSAMIKPNFASDVINLCCHWKPFMSKHVIFNTSYVFDCCALNKKLSLQEFSIGKTLSDEEYREFDERYLHLGDNAIITIPHHEDVDNIDWANAKELDLEDSSELSDSSNIHSSDQVKGQKGFLPKEGYQEDSLPSYSSFKKNACTALSRNEDCGDDNMPSCSSFKRNTCVTYSKNAALDVAATMEIYPEDSVSQVGREAVPSGSSSIENPCNTFESDISSHSAWSRSVRMWLSEDGADSD